jgi:uncharacterized OB-fold protein
MPKQSPVPDEIDKPHFDACNEDRLLVQRCNDCTARNGLVALQHPPQPECRRCGGSNLDWHEASGRGRIQSWAVMYDCPVAELQEDQPFNLAVVELDDDRSCWMLSHLPGLPVGGADIGMPVEGEFEVTPATGQKVAEWKAISA